MLPAIAPLNYGPRRSTRGTLRVYLFCSFLAVQVRWRLSGNCRKSNRDCPPMGGRADLERNCLPLKVYRALAGINTAACETILRINNRQRVLIDLRVKCYQSSEVHFVIYVSNHNYFTYSSNNHVISLLYSTNDAMLFLKI